VIGSVLLVEDNAGDARLLREMFNEDASCTTQLTWVACMREAEAFLSHQSVDVILLDLGLPDSQGMAAVARARLAAPRTPLVVLTGLDDERAARQALKSGAEDYLVKDQIEARPLIRSLRYAIERKSLEEALFAEKDRAQVTLDCIGEAVICTDLAGKVTFLNLVAETMTGWSYKEAVGRPLADVCHIIDDKTREPISEGHWLKLGRSGPSHLPLDCVLVRPDGAEVPLDATIAPIHDRGGQSVGIVLVLRDATIARALTRHVTHSAQHDFLTSLPNRLLLYDRISQALSFAQRYKVQAALLFLDLDGFKKINDSFGHLVGDQLLQSVAARLVGCVRASDTVSRQGGDEFIILLSQMEQPADSVVMAKRLLTAMAVPHKIDTLELQVTASIGVSVFPDDALDAETLIRNADIAMYQAKAAGRHNCTFFRPAMNDYALERKTIEEGLHRALERGEFVLHYQPKIDLKTRAITGAEALIRWIHPTRGLLMPSAFMAVAEESGLIVQIGAWVMRQACLQACAWRQAGLPDTTMALNISAAQFRHGGFINDLLGILAETGMDPLSLDLELTESALIKQAENTARTLQILRASGIRVTIDDFGIGFSNLHDLHRFPVDTLKIDQSFVRQIVGPGNDRQMAGMVIGMARSLRLRVVAEGVEKADELAFLCSHHCDEAQGYFFSPAVLPDEFAKLQGTARFRWKRARARSAALS